jgi:hypothetical protein
MADSPSYRFVKQFTAANSIKFSRIWIDTQLRAEGWLANHVPILLLTLTNQRLDLDVSEEVGRVPNEFRHEPPSLELPKPLNAVLIENGIGTY